MTAEHKPQVMWIELFQDLAVVVIVTALFEGLINSWATPLMLWYLAALLCLYAAWTTMVLLNDRFPSDTLARQILIMVWMVGGVLLACGFLWRNWLDVSALNVGVAMMMGAASLSYYLAGRNRPELATTTRIVTASTALGTVIALVAALPYPDFQYLILVAAAVALVPVITIYLTNMPGTAIARPKHVQERFGQFMLILLGAMFLEILLSVRDAKQMNYVALALGSAILFLLFRAYFQFTQPLGVPTSRRRFQAWILAHFVLTFGFGFSAVALARNTAHDYLGSAPEEKAENIPDVFDGASVGMALCAAYVGLALVAWCSQERSAFLARHFAICAAAILLLDTLLRLFTELGETARSAFLLVPILATAIITARQARRQQVSA